MAKIECKECGKLCEESTFHKSHLRAHKMRMAEYYQKHFPRYDMFDGSMIKFKSVEYYLNSNFNSRENLASWLKVATPEAAKDYIRSYLATRKVRKGLTYAPCQVELRTLLVPGMVYIDRLFGGYFGLCRELGFVLRFNQLGFSFPLKAFGKGSLILQDTREQKPLEFSIQSKPEALKFGDYKLVGLDDCYIERKAVNDLYGTLGMAGYERFRRELDRAREANAYVVVLVEGSFEDVINFPKRPQLHGISMSNPEHIFHRVREILQDYPSVQFLFVKDRKDASKAVEVIFRCNGEYRNTDLQYLYDTGKLI